MAWRYLLVGIKIVVLRARHDSGINLKECLSERVSFLNVTYLHLPDSLLGLIVNAAEVWASK